MAKSSKITIKCSICNRETDDVEKHHVKPVSRGGKEEDTILCCKTCGSQVHMLFTVKELENMTFEELIITEEMKKYIKWVQKKPREFSHKMSRRVKRKRKRR